MFETVGTIYELRERENQFNEDGEVISRNALATFFTPEYAPEYKPALSLQEVNQVCYLSFL